MLRILIRNALARDKLTHNHSEIDVDMDEIVLRRLNYTMLLPTEDSKMPAALSVITSNIPKRKSLEDLKSMIPNVYDLRAQGSWTLYLN